MGKRTSDNFYFHEWCLGTGLILMQKGCHQSQSQCKHCGSNLLKGQSICHY